MYSHVSVPSVAVAFTVIVESATLPCPSTTLAVFVNVLTGPLSTEYVPLTAFFNVSVIVCVSVLNVEPDASEDVMLGSVSDTSEYTYVTVITEDVYVPVAFDGFVFNV